MPRLSWNLMLMLAGFGVLRTAKDSHNRFFGTLLLLTAVQGAALKEIDLSLGSWPIGYHVYILLHLVSIATSPLQLLWSISRLWAKTKRGTGSIPGKQLARATIEYGIKILHEGRDEYGYTSVDIVAVHGLGSNPEWAWRHEETGKEWLKEFLPKTCPKTRIMVFNHNSVWDFDAPIKSVEACGQQLLDALNSVRRTPEEKKRRVIFIGHSFGGIIIKKALVIASVVDEYQEIKNSSLGVIFLGVPHGGSRISPVGVLMSYTTYWIGSTSELLKVLQPGGDSLKELNHSFLISVRHPSIKIVNFYETKKSKVWGIPFWMAVDQDSSTIPGTKNCALEADHIGMNKFGSEGGRYSAVANEIKLMVKKVEDEYSIGLENEQRENINNLDWLGSEVRREAIGQPHKSTLQWVDKHNLTSSWLGGESKVVWVSGKAGSGKSTLSKYILGRLEESNSDPRKTTVLSFFFSNRGSDLDKSHQGMLQSLLAQLLEKIPPLSIHIPQKYKTKGDHVLDKKVKWTISDLQKILVTSIESSKDRIIFVVIGKPPSDHGEE